MGKLQRAAADPDSVPGGRHVFTSEERERGSHVSADRARRRRVLAARRFKEWARRDAQLWRNLEHARLFGSERQQRAARKAWSDHASTMPVEGRRA